jgi:hypothetical protein
MEYLRAFALCSVSVVRAFLLSLCKFMQAIPSFRAFIVLLSHCVHASAGVFMHLLCLFSGNFSFDLEVFVILCSLFLGTHLLRALYAFYYDDTVSSDAFSTWR